MFGKLIDLILKFAEMRYGPRAVLVRDLKSLHSSLEDCQAKYKAMKAIDDSASDAFANAEREHRDATKTLIAALSKFEELFKMHAPDGIWQELNSYVRLEKMVHPKETFLVVVHDSVPAGGSGDYDTALEKLRTYIRDNLKPEEVQGDR